MANIQAEGADDMPIFKTRSCNLLRMSLVDSKIKNLP